MQTGSKLDNVVSIILTSEINPGFGQAYLTSQRNLM